MYNYNHLYYFYCTAKAGSVMTAAKQLRISQPSLSSQLKVLENSLGTKLFRRVGRRNQLTEEGQVIYGYCRQMFELAEDLSEALSKDVPSASRRIRIGVSEEVDRPFVVEVVSLFLKKHGVSQRPKVSVVSGQDAQLSERLRSRELDAIVTENAMLDPDLVNLEAAFVPVALACPGSWKIRSDTRKMKAAAAVREIVGGEDAQWVMPSAKFKLRLETNQFFEKNRLKGRIVFESDVVSSLVRSVIDEIGMAFLPLLYVARELRESSIQVLGPPTGFWKHRVWLICHQQNRRDPLIQSVSRSFKEICDGVGLGKLSR